MKKTKEANQMTLAGTDEAEILARLGERVEKAIATIQELRRERDALRARLDKAEQRLREQAEGASRLILVESECERFKAERTEVRNRIETILGSLEQLDGLTEGE
jgi:FtsZ-binding cell division protein ZapB